MKKNSFLLYSTAHISNNLNNCLIDLWICGNWGGYYFAFSRLLQAPSRQKGEGIFRPSSEKVLYSCNFTVVNCWDIEFPDLSEGAMGMKKNI